ncbi:glycoside hydrolase family 113 [Spongiimicrobium sp. 3-5]|uniref:glycoside hydrolase family 113 n=1 Tax=Spongiimicrobium sp. 3-5 TaxID=3332596 RepID=UPI0039809577
MKKIGLLLICLLQLSCQSQPKEKINGVSFVASREKATQADVKPVLEVHASYAAVMPFGFIRNLSSPEVIFDTDRQWFGETRKGAEQYIGILKKNKIKVMLKPQIWIWRGEFTGGLKMNSESDWKVLEQDYEKFIMTYAEVAEQTSAEILCIGTELEQFVKNRPEYWKNLIKKIRAVYKGKLTYAANWDEYPRTSFWEDLDFIGIDAYFPLSEAKTPSVNSLRAAWQPHKEKIAALAATKNKPVLFTEYGYRSMDFTAKKPWLVDRNQMDVNFEGQANAQEAIFEEFWGEQWFAGGFVWKWFLDHNSAGGAECNRFTPQNKPAQIVLQQFYKMY